MQRSTKRGLAIAVVAGTFAGSSLAFAAFTTGDEPWAPGQVATVQHLQSTATVDGVIWAGDCNNVTLVVTNPNPHGVTITTLGNQGFKDVSDTSASENGNANRLLDFLYQADVTNALNGLHVSAGGTKTFVVKNAVCLRGTSDDARQGDSFKAGYSVAASVNPGTEATG